MSTPPPVANFQRAEYAGDPQQDNSCSFCQHLLPSEYFRVNNQIACVACAQRAESLAPPDSRKAYVRGLAFGIGAAIAGCVGYSVVQSFGFMIGFIAIGVGWLVGTAMMKGSRGVGGRRYQITAALLAYLAISMAFLPLLFQAFHEQELTKQKTTQSSSAQNQDGKGKKDVTFGEFLVATGLLLGMGVISPVLKFFIMSVGSGIFGLVFLFFGVQAAWKLTAQRSVEIKGPFEHATG